MNILNLDNGDLQKLPPLTEGDGSFLDKKRLENALAGMDPCDDVFAKLSSGRFLVRKDSKILHGHFEGMPIVPGVVIKRLFAKHTKGSTYDQAVSKNAWVFEFVSPLLPGTEVSFVEAGHDLVKLLAGNQVIAQAERKHVGEEWYVQDVREVISKASMLPNASVAELDRYLLQSAPFRFVGNADFKGVDGFGLSKDEDIFYGKFLVPPSFHLAQQNWAVFPEIMEEMVAQMGSVAIARRMNHENAANQQRQVLTFAQSVVGRSYDSLVRDDKLSVVGKLMVDRENPRKIGFRYNAYNSDHYPVICWEIWGKRVPLNLLKKLLGNPAPRA